MRQLYKILNIFKMEDEIYLKNIKEFLQNYNKITDECFTQCVYSFSQSKLSEEEQLCANNCVQKANSVGQKCMQGFIEHQQKSMQKLAEEANKQNLIEQENNNIQDVPIPENNSPPENQKED
ncbi:mitochondrial import inner membrane translocase subunit Tim9-like [Daktulosphaira vitifoliae]|uniref:mitochondrial import inner membrane translocase subunit Tim9-like n=1 Tax=Daktulosphaira vitifoliae TaxID=58002 RepID=UPI0021AA474B|nr:mitochondrial import inner membrane translocase subunit Tim9-like [Daktulosphaira vitifoliae]